MSLLSDAAASIAARNWVEIAQNSTAAAVLGGANAGGASLNILGYAFEMDFDPIDRIGYFCGSDHIGTGDNLALVKYTEATNNWETIIPKGSIPFGHTHGYDHTALNPATDIVYTIRRIDSNNMGIYRKLPGSSLYETSPIQTIVDGTQVAMQSAWWSGPLSGGDSGGTYVICSGSSGKIHFYNPVTNTVFANVLVPPGDLGLQHGYVVYNPTTNNAVLSLGNSPDVWRLDSDRTVTKLTNAPFNIGAHPNNGRMCFDPNSGLFIALGQDILYSLVAATDVWTELNLAGDAVPSNMANLITDGADSCIVFPYQSPSNGSGVVFVTGRSGSSTFRMFLYKYSEVASGTPLLAMVKI